MQTNKESEVVSGECKQWHPDLNHEYNAKGCIPQNSRSFDILRDHE
jgi:hypothetical protein